MFDGNADDGSGYGYHGTVQGATLATDSFGNAESAYYFDGEDDYIWLGDDILPEHISISVWINTTSTKTGHDQTLAIIRYRLYGYGIFMNSINNVGRISTFVHQNDDHSSISLETPENHYDDGNWYHIVFTYDNNAFKLYIDSELMGTSDIQPPGNIFYQNGGIAIGRDGGSASDYFQGLIDDVRIYNRALSESEIKTLYHQKTGPQTPTLTLTKTGPGRGSVNARLKGEPATLSCHATCAQAEHTYDSGHHVILNARPHTGFIFEGWSGDCSGNETRITLIMDTAKHCTAQFGLDPNITLHALTIYTTGSGQGTVKSNQWVGDCQNGCTVYYPPEQKIRLTATAQPLSRFQGWQGDCSDQQRPTARLLMTQDLSCTAIFNSDFATIPQTLIDALYAYGQLESGAELGSTYPRSANEARLLKAFWQANIPILHADQHLSLTDNTWPQQLQATIWYQPLPATEATQSIITRVDHTIEIRLGLLNQAGEEKQVAILINYSDGIPTAQDVDEVIVLNRDSFSIEL